MLTSGNVENSNDSKVFDNDDDGDDNDATKNTDKRNICTSSWKSLNSKRLIGY